MADGYLHETDSFHLNGLLSATTQQKPLLRGLGTYSQDSYS